LNEENLIHLKSHLAGQPAERRTFLVGLIGKDIQRSKSPMIHEQEARELGLVMLYQLLDLNMLKRDVDSLGEILYSAELLGFAGLNITHPAKQATIPLLQELSEEARVIGAVNTVKFVGGIRRGYNTDASGFADSFRRGLPGAPLERVVQIGAGGAGAATAYAMLKLGAGHLTIIDTLPARAAGLVQNLAKFFDPSRLSTSEDAASALRTAQGLVHATPTGMREYPGLPVPANALHGGLWVAEIVYFPLETELLRLAKAKGCRTLDGGGMAVFQAAAAFEIFTGKEVDRERMLRHFREIPQD
jgi:quinate/shikimate dehydrogenase (NAD+)